jgi:hypothetical protein
MGSYMKKIWIKVYGRDAADARDSYRFAIANGMPAPTPDNPQTCTCSAGEFRVLHDFTVEKLVDPAEVGRNFCIKVLGVSPEKCDEIAARQDCIKASGV